MAALPAAGQEQARHLVLRDVSREAAVVRSGGYQGRNNGPQQTERFSRKVKIGRDGRFSLSNISGDIVVTAGSGDEVSIDAVKRTRGDKSELEQVQIIVDDRAGRVDVRTEHDRVRSDRNRQGDHVSVDYTVVVPASASVDLHSISGSVKVTGVHGSLRSESISGDVTVADAPKLEVAKTVSGSVSLTGITTDGDLTATSVSGSVHARGLKARGLDVGTVSGDISVAEAACERLEVKTVSGGVEYSGGIARGGRYEINSHSGTVRMILANPAGFELNANSFSGSIRSELPLTLGGDATRPDDGARRGRRGGGDHALRATFGDGSATLVVRTFSGDIIISKR